MFRVRYSMLGENRAKSNSYHRQLKPKVTHCLRGTKCSILTLVTFPARADVVMLGNSLTEVADWHAMLPDVDVANHGITRRHYGGVVAAARLSPTSAAPHGRDHDRRERYPKGAQW